MCKQIFSTKEQIAHHVCPVYTKIRDQKARNLGSWLPVKTGPIEAPPDGWWAATDGSGKEVWIEGNAEKQAGWGVVIFKWPIEGFVPDYVLHGPVVTEEWENVWLGAREKTNNTGELTAIIELMIWLLEEAPDTGGASHDKVRLILRS